MTPAEELIDFLTMRLDEDAWWAREASRYKETYVETGMHWVWETHNQDLECELDPATHEYVGEDHQYGTVALRSREEFATCYSRRTISQAAIPAAEEVPVAVGGYIIRHDPATELREIAAKRQLIRMYQWFDKEFQDTANELAGLWIALKLATLRYSEHPHYNKSWAV